MAKQTGQTKITGQADGIIFYKMEKTHYARRKSSLDGNRVKKDPAFSQTMKHAWLLAKASKLASVVYRNLLPSQKSIFVYRKLTGMAIRNLKEGKNNGEILKMLSDKFSVQN